MRMALPAFRSKPFPFEKYKGGCVISHLQSQHLGGRGKRVRSSRSSSALQWAWDQPGLHVMTLSQVGETERKNNKTKYHRAVKLCAQISHKYKTARELISVRKSDPNQANMRTKPRVLSPYQSGECLPLVTLNLRELLLGTLGQV